MLRSPQHGGLCRLELQHALGVSAGDLSAWVVPAWHAGAATSAASWKPSRYTLALIITKHSRD